MKSTVTALKAVKDMQANFDKRQKAFEKEQRQRLTELQSHDQAEAGLTSTAMRDLAREFTTMRREVEKDRARTATLTKKLDGVTNAVAKEQRRRSGVAFEAASERREHTAAEAAPTSPTVSSRGRVRQPSPRVLASRGEAEAAAVDRGGLGAAVVPPTWARVITEGETDDAEAAEGLAEQLATPAESPLALPQRKKRRAQRSSSGPARRTRVSPVAADDEVEA